MGIPWHLLMQMIYFTFKILLFILCCNLWNQFILTKLLKFVLSVYSYYNDGYATTVILLKNVIKNVIILIRNVSFQSRRGMSIFCDVDL